MKYIGFIPARLDSTRLPGKPLVKILGKFMIQHVYENVLPAFGRDNLFVVTPDDLIGQAVDGFGGKSILTGWVRSGTDRCLEAFKRMKEAGDPDVDVIINIQGDEPLVRSEQIEALKSVFKRPVFMAATNVDFATLATPTRALDMTGANAYVTLDCFSNAMYFSRYPIPYVKDTRFLESHFHYKTIGVYGYTPDVLWHYAQLPSTMYEKAEGLEQNRWLEMGNKIRVVRTRFGTVGVDTEEDLARVKEIMSLEE